MHRLFLLFLPLVIAAVPVMAQIDVPDERPPELVPLDDSVQPEVTVVQREGETVEEYRLNDRLYKIKVTPASGEEQYILIDHRGDGSFVRQEGSGMPGFSIPQWVIGTF
ncbi:MAG: DUF2782 domain-containing protein [Candidatus Accumulibacter sp.]|jgi:hypothetical protein|nr:DUF2782 domain-containing protein [Accumulibacter sp.]